MRIVEGPSPDRNRDGCRLLTTSRLLGAVRTVPEGECTQYKRFGFTVLLGEDELYDPTFR